MPHSIEVTFVPLTQRSYVSNPAQQRYFLLCLVCGQEKYQTHLVFMQGILQMQLVAKALAK